MRSDPRRRFWRIAIVALAVLGALVANTLGCELGSNCANGICQTDVVCDDAGCVPVDGGITHGGG